MKVVSTRIVESLPIVAENFSRPDRGVDGSPRLGAGKNIAMSGSGEKQLQLQRPKHHLIGGVDRKPLQKALEARVEDG